MPGFYLGSTIDQRRWSACQEAAAKKMVADGWSQHARKFNEVCKRRTARLYRDGGAA